MARLGRCTVGHLEAAIDGALAGASYKTVERLTGSRRPRSATTWRGAIWPVGASRDGAGGGRENRRFPRRWRPPSTALRRGSIRRRSGHPPSPNAPVCAVSPWAPTEES